MRGKKQIIKALPTLGERELTLVWRDCRRAADAAAIGGATEAQWNQYRELEHEIENECERRFGTKPNDYLNREGEDELAQIYERIFSRKREAARTRGEQDQGGEG